MPGRKLRVDFASTADRDYHNILFASEDQWGKRQRSTYRGLIRRALRTVSTNPEIGKQRDDLANGLRSYPAGEHVLFYRITSNAVSIARILHQRQSADDVIWTPVPRTDEDLDL